MADKDYFDELEEKVTELVEDLVPGYVEEAIEEAGEDSVRDIVHDILGESLANCELALKDGSVIRSKPMMILMNPDQTLTLRCFGGLRVRKAVPCESMKNTRQKQLLSEMLSSMGHKASGNEAWCLDVQTWVSTWERIATFTAKKEATEALRCVNDALVAGQVFYQIR